MANSKFEYVRSYELTDEIFEPDLIVLHIQAYDFIRFSDTHQFEKPNDENAVNLMNSCATAILEKYPDIIFGYGFSDEYSFVLARESTFHNRRASKILSLIGSFFTSVYVKRWKDYFGNKICLFPPSFQSRVIACASNDVLQAYLAWKQTECRAKNQRNICLSLPLKCGNIEKEVKEFLKGSKNQDKYELLYQQLGLNHEELPDIFHQGSCVFRTEVEVIVKYLDNGIPIKRLRKMLQIVHHKNIASSRFWNEQSVLVEKLGSFQEEINEVKPEYIKSFLFDKELIPSTWVVIRIDGHDFSKFSEVHEFEKPNDEHALNLMNSCAVAVLNEFQDIIFSYGISDEYSFVLKKDSQFHQRRSSAIVSTIVSLFTSVYINNWKIFFPNKELEDLPCFDGRAVCYTSEKLVRDYLAWRQVDCHINNQYNTCFWMLVKSGKSESEAHDYLKGSRAQQKIELLAQQFGIEYYNLPLMFRYGSSVFRDMVEEREKVVCIDSPQTRKKEQEDEMVARVDNYREKIVTEHCSIIEQDFWCAHPHILLNERNQLGLNTKFEYVRSYEFKDEVFEPRLIVIRIQAYDFLRFSGTHQFENPNDEKALNLMNSCATAILEKYPDIIFGYGFSDEYSFVLARESKFCKRRASKISSLVVSFFTSVYVKRWKAYFGKKIMLFPPSFQSRIIACSSTDVLQAYLSWRQSECHAKNQHNTCISLMVKCGKTEKEAVEFLKGSEKKDKHELLFQQFGLNYKELPDMFRQGSCVLKTKKKVKVIHSRNIASKSFWNEQLLLVKEVGNFQEEIKNVNPGYIKSFQFDEELIPTAWIVVRINGRHFHKFSEVHKFKKPNDERALNLMKSCAFSVLNEFQDIIFSYGGSDEYSFVLKRDSQFHQRRASGIVSSIVSFFSSVYIKNWAIFFPNKELKYPPCFEGRAVCCPSEMIVRGYLAWRQVVRQINYQYNTCFWMLLKSGKSKREADNYLKGCQTEDMNKLLAQQFGIEYHKLPVMFRHGSSIFWDMVHEDERVARIDNLWTRKKEPEDEMVASVDNYRGKLVTEHSSIIEQDFWLAHPHILLDERNRLGLKTVQPKWVARQISSSMTLKNCCLLVFVFSIFHLIVSSNPRPHPMKTWFAAPLASTWLNVLGTSVCLFCGQSVLSLLLDYFQ